MSNVSLWYFSNIPVKIADYANFSKIAKKPKKIKKITQNHMSDTVYDT